MPAYSQGLDQGHEAAAEQVGTDQRRHLLGRQLESTADDQRHGDGARIHDEHVLQAQGKQFASWQDFIDGRWRGRRGTGHAAVDGFQAGRGHLRSISWVTAARMGAGEREKQDRNGTAGTHWRQMMHAKLLGMGRPR
ncbi:hypothetical protein D3C81_1140670 [compost metagenome]